MHCITRTILLPILLIVLAAPVVTWAATVTFDQTSLTVSKGSTFDLSIIGVGFTELAGGTIDLSYDNGVVDILTVTVSPYWDFEPDGGSKTGPGLWSEIGFDVFDNQPASGDVTIVTMSLMALAEGTSHLSILDSSSFFSQTELLSPTINHSTTTVVPVPAALWLLASGLGGIIMIACGRSRAAHAA